MGRVQGDGEGQDFPKGLVQFANQFCKLQSLRVSADYDWTNAVTVADARQEVANARNAIDGFEAATDKDKAAFLVWTILERRDD
jgi:hypothetical protein